MKKVSLISPCYNGSKYLKWFLDSLIEQTYQNVEFIFVNDGSTDNTEEIFMSYKPKLEEKGWDIIYIKQENKDQAEAINQGLKIFTGDYLICPDSDDILYPNHIEEKVNFMEKNPDCGLAFNIVDVVDENNNEKIVNTFDNKKIAMNNFIDNILQLKLDIWGSVSNIIRSRCLLEKLSERKIVASRVGQNFQLLYPVVNNYEVKFIDQSLGKYVVRKDSHSHKKENFLTNRTRVYDLYDMVLNTILYSSDKMEKKLLNVIKTSTYFFPLLFAQSETIKSSTKKIKLFNLIPLIKVKKKNNKTRVYFLGILILTIKEK